MISRRSVPRKPLAAFLAETREWKKRLEKSGLSVQVTPTPKDLVEQFDAAKRD